MAGHEWIDDNDVDLTFPYLLYQRVNDRLRYDGALARGVSDDKWRLATAVCTCRVVCL
jgi:hypothetical protein